jgi:SpoVK/Ycf46/Vps4 family AAA+-type ATPase
MPVSMEDFIGTHNMIGSIVDVNNQKEPPNPSFAQIRELVMEHAILPLGSKVVRERTAEPVKTMLFFGQPGSGKTMMTRIVAHESASAFLNMSPDVLEDFCTDAKTSEKIVASVMRVAKDLQPSVIYIDECERFFPKKQSKKKKHAASKKSFGKVKKLLDKYKKSFIKDNRILIIGCTHEIVDKKEAKKFFNKSIFFPYPDHTNSRIMWKYMIEKCGGIIPPDFQLSTLASISEGYTCGIIKKICQQVITERRKQTVFN